MAGPPVGSPVGPPVGTPVGSPGRLPFLGSDFVARIAAFIVNYLSGTAIPEKGAGYYGFDRSTSPTTVVDFEGLVKDTLADEVSYQGQRRVETLMNISRTDIVYDTGAASWSEYGGASIAASGLVTLNATSGYAIQDTGSQETTVIGHTYIASAMIAGGTCTDLIFACWDGGTDAGKTDAVDAAANVGKRITAKFVATTVSAKIEFWSDALGGNVLLTDFMFEDVTGQVDNNTACSEYLPLGAMGDDYTLQTLPDAGLVAGDIDDWAPAPAGNKWSLVGTELVFDGDTAASSHLFGLEPTVMDVQTGQTFQVSIDITITKMDSSVCNMGVYNGWQWSVLSNAAITGLSLGSHTITFDTLLCDNGARSSDEASIWISCLTITGAATFTLNAVRLSIIDNGSNKTEVKYFPTKNGNTYANFLTTLGSGAQIPVGTTNKGLQVWEARTNLQEYTEDLSSWDTPLNCGTVANDGVAPDGATTATRLTPNGGGSVQHYVAHLQASVIAATYTLSAYVKPGTDTVVQLAATAGTFGGNAHANFQLTGAGSVTQFGVSLVDYGIELLDTGYYRCWITAVSSGVSVAGGLIVVPCEGNTSLGRLAAYTATGLTMHVSGTQIEQGVFRTPYIPSLSTGSTTRNADNLSHDASNWDDTLDSMSVTGSFSLPRDGNVSTVAQTIFSIHGTATAAVITLSVALDGKVQAIRVDGASNFFVASTPVAHVKEGVTYKFAVRFSKLVNESALYIDGVALSPTLNAASGALAFDEFLVGQTDGGLNHLNGHAKDIRLYQQQLTDEDLEALST